MDRLAEHAGISCWGTEQIVFFFLSLLPKKSHHRTMAKVKNEKNIEKSLIGLIRRISVTATNAIIPPTCLACDSAVGHPGLLCPVCWSSLRFIEKPYCAVLGSPFSYDPGEGALSAQAIASPPVFNKARSVLLYDEVPRVLVQGLKYSDRTELAPWMAKWMLRAGKELFSDDCLIVPVPLHRWRLLKRKFNQSAELARYVASQHGLPYHPLVLQRIRPTRQQVGLNAGDRISNVRGAFRVPPDQSIHFKSRPVVLVDDVFTTGATLQACARALRRGGATRIDCLTFARVADGVAITNL
jgi:ComF family protein